MSNLIGISVILTNLAVVGAFIYTAHILTKSVKNVEARVTRMQEDASTKFRRVVKDLL